MKPALLSIIIIIIKIVILECYLHHYRKKITLTLLFFAFDWTN